MQRGENEREQDPVYGHGGPQPPSPAEQPATPAAGDQPPSASASEQQPQPNDTAELPYPYPASAYPASTGQPDHDPGSTPTDAIWFGNQTRPGYPAADQPHAAYQAAGRPPPYPGVWAPPAGGWPPPPGGGPGVPWGTEPRPPRSRGRRVLSFALVAIIGIAIGAAAAFGLAHNTGNQPASPGAGAVPAPGSQRAPLQNTGNSQINSQAIANAVSPSVVDITSRLPYQNETAQGTGIVINSSGLVLTNNHVINGATQVTGQINGAGRIYGARVLGTDKTDDIALLQLQGASRLKAASIGDSDKVAIGDQVVAIGNLGGQGGTPTVTSGAITALNRTITAGDQGSGNTETLHGVLQTDASIGSGDSGGPLVNARGQVIGMDTAAASDNFGQSQSIGFAIPINHALSIAREIAAGHGSSTIQIGLPGFLGVNVCDISRAAECMNNGVNFGGFGNTSIAPVSSGALVAGVLNGTPAESVGMSAGDVITGLDGTRITSAQSLTNIMRSHRPGDQVSVSWVDTSGQRHTTTVTLTTGPAA